ncbi:hypothetical protein [Chitinophaga sp. Cy-1792]|uniref:hypothetical protein n=1 Tax=Chitinophaga sp. Cy-1792 TaxID=2608339 RepID=UPI001420E213|nr:hypothetical protein [Chitinophaga sp. Cy-1792]NIG55265.1 hypothetical protein [Chitinophaga sp. Cy-1792]
MNFQVYKASAFIRELVIFLLIAAVVLYVKPNADACMFALLLIRLQNAYERVFKAHLHVTGDILTIKTKNIFGRKYEYSFPVQDGRYAITQHKSVEIYNEEKSSVLVLSAGSGKITVEEIDAVAALLEQHGMKQGYMVIKSFRKVWRPA